MGFVMFIKLPDWYSTAKEKLEQKVMEIAIENKLNVGYVKDSKIISDSIDSITMRLVNLPQDKDIIEAEKVLNRKGGRNGKKGN